MARAKSVLLNANWPSGGLSGESLYSDLNTNVGNGYISAAFARRVNLGSQDIRLANNLWSGRSHATEVERGASGCEWAFLNLQDQLRLSFPPEIYEAALETLVALPPETRLVIFSLSANEVGASERVFIEALARPVRAFFDFLGERAFSIGVRGEISGSVLRRMGLHNVVVAGCPSYFDCGTRRIVAPAVPGDHRVAGLTGSFRAPALDDAVLYLQGGAEWPLVQLLHETPSEWRSGGGPKAAPGATVAPQDLLAAGQGRARFFTDIAAWSADLRDTCAVVCGTRLHGAIVALNAGVPAIVTNGDVRARETCELFGIPWRPDLMAAEPRLEDLAAISDPAELNRLYPERFATFEAWVKPFEQSRGKRDAGMNMPQGPARRPPDEIIARAMTRLAGNAPLAAAALAASPRVSAAALEDVVANLLANPAFEAGWTGWTPLSRNADAFAWRRRYGPSGWWIELREDIGPDADLGLCSEWVEARPGEPLALSLDLALFSAVEGGLNADLEWRDASGQTLAYSAPVQAGSPVFRRASAVFTCPAGGAAARVRLYVSNLTLQRGQGWAAATRVKLERSDRPSAFSLP